MKVFVILLLLIDLVMVWFIGFLCRGNKVRKILREQLHLIDTQDPQALGKLNMIKTLNDKI